MPTTPAIPSHHLVACHDCDLLFAKPQLHVGEKASCPRCGALLFEHKRGNIDHTLALAVTSLILFVLANVNTLLGMSVGGRTQTGTILSGVEELYAQGFWEIAVLVFIVSILAPLVKILCLCYVLVPLRLNVKPPKAAWVFRLFEHLHPWAMTEVYMLGILVAVVKLADLAAIEVGVALYSFAALIFFMAATDATLDTHEVWERLEDSA